MKKREIYQRAVRDFYGASKFRERVLLKYLLKQNKPKITDDEKDAVWHIKTNLSDPIYRRNLLLN